MQGRKQSRGLAAAVLVTAAVVCSRGAPAQPVGPTAVFGGAQVQQLGNNVLVTTSNGPGSNRSVIDWRSFSVPANSVTHFQQPSVDSTSINRVTGNKPSEIFGTLSSNGQLVLVNPSGIAVGKGAVIDTAGFTASALSLSDEDAIAGRLRFGAGKDKANNVHVAGSVLARSGDVVLLGTEVQVDKEAVVRAPNGAVILAAGQRIALTGRGLEGIVLELTSPQDRAVNLGRLEGDAVGIFASQLRHTGVIQAQHVVLLGDRVKLEKGGPKDKDGKDGKDPKGDKGPPGDKGPKDSGNGGSDNPPPPAPDDPDVTGSIDTAPPPPAPPASGSNTPSSSSAAQPPIATASQPDPQATTILAALIAHDSAAITNNGEVVAGLQAPTFPGAGEQDRRAARVKPDPAQQCTR